VGVVPVDDVPHPGQREAAHRKNADLRQVGFADRVARDHRDSQPAGHRLLDGLVGAHGHAPREATRSRSSVTIAAIFFLLFLLFNSVRFAALIITVLPFASIGGVIGLAVTGEYLSVPASVGFIALWGIAVLNGVVLVTYIRKLRDDGMDLARAVVEGATQRFRPVMMTATVAMLGLITCTLLTLVVVPVLYRFFEERRIEA
jgi:Cu/Ag efflux pump CusA